jgi:hypothetical protein
MADDEIQDAGTSEEEIRKQAIDSIKRKRAFQQTLFAYLLINALLIGVWALSGQGYFWPAWVIGGWGIGLGFQAYDAYRRRRSISEVEIQREAQRIRGGR